MGYREPYDYRKPSCFSARDITPDCRQIVPFNYESKEAKVVEAPQGDQGQAVYFPDANFDFNARSLNELGRAKVKTVAAILSHEGGVKVVLEGHTDKRGSDKYNDKLGLDRAEAVKGELVKLGIPATDLSTVSFGESRPLFNEDAEWAYAANRRVEVHIGGKSEEVAPVEASAAEVAAPAKVPDAPPVPAKLPAASKGVTSQASGSK
jgi:outer membrane protein OmpA-like peptidoglycan-associated protein